MERNDFDALRAAFAGVRSTGSKLQGMESAIASLADASAENPPGDLIRAATAHALAAAAFSGLLHRLFAPGGAPPGSGNIELTDSAGESAS